MKKWQKFVLLVMSFNILFFAVDAKKREAEAFALTSTALIVGAIATIALGGVVVSQAVTSSFGQDIIDKLEDDGFSIGDYLMEAAISGFMTLRIKNELKNIMNTQSDNRIQTIEQNRKFAVRNYDERIPTTVPNKQVNTALPIVPIPFYSTVSVGDIVTVDFEVFEDLPAGTAITFIAEGSAYGNLAQPIEFTYTYLDSLKAGHHTVDAVVNDLGKVGMFEHGQVDFYLKVYPKYGEDIGYSNPYKIGNVSLDIRKPMTADSEEVYQQFASVPLDSTARMGKIDNILKTGTTFTVDKNVNVTGASNIRDITTTIPVNPDDIDVGNGETLGFLGGILSAIKALAGWIFQAFSAALASIIGGISNISDMIDSFMGMISSLFGSLMSAISGISSTLWNVATNITNAIRDLGSTITSPISSVAADMWNVANMNLRAFADMIGSVPNSINEFASDLWVDAGLVWSGIKDSVNATNTWLNNVLAGALDGLSNGIDNLSRVFQDTWAGIEAGLAAIGQNVIALPQTFLDDLTEIKTGVTALAIPTALDMTTYTNKMDELRQNMTSKFEFITLPIQQIKSVFAAPKSLYDVKFTVLEQDVYVLPRMFEPVVNITKNVLTGSAVISTFIAIYRRFTPEEVIA